MPSKKPKAIKTPSSPEAADREAVLRLAYELYVRRGCEPWHDVEDWLMAEQILIEKRTVSPSRRPAAKATRRLEDKFKK